ncbi:MAG: DnaA/Hda family protein [Planctomycetota bacterium]|nr:DnaA/Hda family protein [Planctomycetota bacterium]
MVVSDVFSIPLHVNGPSLVQPTDRDPQSSWDLREFIGGQENSLCRVASESLFQDPPRYNPLVFFGPAATGKSALARGLAARWKQLNRSAKAVVTSGADFARDYSHALETDSLADFRAKYRRASLLVIDDLHQLGERASVQNELACTLDVLLDRGHRILVTLPQMPTECSSLLSGLASRLSAGLTVPLVVPGPTARRQILMRLAEFHQLHLSEELLAWIANHPSNGASPAATVPEIHKLMLQLAQVSQQQGRPLDARLLRKLFAAHNKVPKTPLRSITRLVCKYFHLRNADLKGPTRQQRIVRARGVAMLLARQLTGESLEQVGRHFGNRDHTTVLHACRKTESLIEHDPAIRQAVEDLTLQLSAT